MKKGGSGNKRYRHFHGVHQIKIFFARFGAAAHAQDAILAVKIDGDASWQMIGNQVRNTPAQVYVGTVGEFACRTHGDLFTGEALLLRHSESLWPPRRDAQKLPGSPRFPDRWSRRARLLPPRQWLSLRPGP